MEAWVCVRYVCVGARMIVVHANDAVVALAVCKPFALMMSPCCGHGREQY